MDRTEAEDMFRAIRKDNLALKEDAVWDKWFQWLQSKLQQEGKEYNIQAFRFAAREAQNEINRLKK